MEYSSLRQDRRVRFAHGSPENVNILSMSTCEWHETGYEKYRSGRLKASSLTPSLIRAFFVYCAILLILARSLAEREGNPRGWIKEGK